MKHGMILLGLTSVMLVSCKMADVRTNYMHSSTSIDDERKGRQLLEASVEAMGYNALPELDAYEVTAYFDWRLPWSLMPVNSLPGAKRNEIRFRFRPDSFDGQVEYLEGRKKGAVYGLQSWETYKIKDNSPVLRNDKRRSWGLATFHYILESPYRLLNADIITYAGETTFEGKEYDLVFVTWERPEPHKEHDHWLLYINKETKFIDLSNLTIRDFFAPFPPKLAEGTARFIAREKAKSGIYFPSNLVIQLLDPKKEKKHIYRVTFKEYEFNSFDVSDLNPMNNLKRYNDEKPGK